MLFNNSQGGKMRKVIVVIHHSRNTTDDGERDLLQKILIRLFRHWAKVGISFLLLAVSLVVVISTKDLSLSWLKKQHKKSAEERCIYNAPFFKQQKLFFQET